MVDYHKNERLHEIGTSLKKIFFPRENFTDAIKRAFEKSHHKSALPSNFGGGLFIVCICI